MRQKILYILLMITTALSWSLEAEAQTTYYVLSDTGNSEVTVMDRWSSNKNVTYKLSGTGKTISVDHYKIRSATNDITVYGFESDNGSGTSIELQKLSSNTNWETTTIDISSYPRIRSIKFSGGGTERKYIRNVSVTRATTLSSSTTSLTGFRTTPYGTDEKTITVDYNNTYGDAVLTGTCDNSNFVVVQENMGETGSKAIKVQYKPSSVGTHSGTVTLKMGTASKNNYVNTSFTVSGTCYLTYSFSALANTNNNAFGTTQVDLDGQTGTSVNTFVESSNTSETKTATFKASPVEGYNFIGWYSDDTYQNRVSTSAEYGVTLTSNTMNTSSSSTLYAKFEVNKTAAQQAITEFEENYEDLTEDIQAAIDLATAKRALEAATTVAEVNAAVAILKQFDEVSFDESISNQIEKGESLSTSGLATSSNNFNITYTSASPSIIKVEGGNLVAVGVGSAIITATTTGEGFYKGSATRSFTSFTHDKGTATITIDVPTSLTIGDEVENVYTLSNNTITPIVTFSEEGILAFEDGKIKATGSGKVIMYVSQEESDDWNPVQAEKEITVEKYANAVTWKKSPITSLMALGTLDLTGYASATSGNITYSSSNTEVITIEGNILTAQKAGNATITASVAASDKYGAASNTLEFVVTLVPTTIKWEQTLPALNDRGGNSVTLTASVIDNEGNTIPDAIVTYASNNTGVATISGNSLTPKSGGSATITASYAGNDVYAAAANVTKDMSVTGYSYSTTWVNDASPANGATFYISSVQTGNFMQGGQAQLTTDSKTATPWTLEATGDAYYVSTIVGGTTYYFHMESGGCDTKETDKDPTSWGIHQNQITFTAITSGANAPYYRLHNGNYHAYNTSGTSIETDNNRNNTSSQWYLISPDQYAFRLTNAPEAVENYLYAEKYAAVVGDIRTELAGICANTTSNFAEANARIIELERAFDEYLASVSTLALNPAAAPDYYPATYGHVVLNRTFKSGYNTIALPFAVNDLNDLGAYKAYQLSIVTYNKEDGYSLYFREATSLEANQPYIIEMSAEKTNPEFTDVEVVAASPVTITAGNGYSGYASWSMHSNYTPDFDMEGKYGVVNSEGKLMMGGEGSTLSAFSAYITGPAAPAQVKAAYVDGERVDAILEALMGENGPQEIYDLQGRKPNVAQRGINIIRQQNGTVKKVMIK